MVITGRKIKFSAVAKISYLLFILISVMYVKNVLDEDSFKVTEKEPDKKMVKVKEAKVNLVVQTVDGQREYSAKLTDSDSVQDLLSDLRDNTDFYYEADMYTYGTELVSVFGQSPSNGSKWAVFLDDKDITKNISKNKLQNNAVYSIKQVPIQVSD